jgi:hypothetical protein
MECQLSFRLCEFSYALIGFPCAEQNEVRSQHPNQQKEGSHNPPYPSSCKQNYSNKEQLRPVWPVDTPFLYPRYLPRVDRVPPWIWTMGSIERHSLAVWVTGCVNVREPAGLAVIGGDRYEVALHAPSSEQCWQEGGESIAVFERHFHLRQVPRPDEYFDYIAIQ